MARESMYRKKGYILVYTNYQKIKIIDYKYKFPWNISQSV